MTSPANDLFLSGVTIPGDQTNKKVFLSNPLVELGESRTIRPGDRLSINKSTSRQGTSIGGEVVLMPMGIFAELILLLRQSTTKCIAMVTWQSGFCARI